MNFCRAAFVSALIGIIPPVSGSMPTDWPQDGANSGRTGWISQEPQLPWRFAWSWNGPDERGGAGGHRYHQPKPHEPWEARICAGGGMVFAPAGSEGLYALNAADGRVAWQFTKGTIHAAAACDAARGEVFAGTVEGTLVRLRVQDGSLSGSFETGGSIRKSLLLAGGRLFTVTTTGALHCLSAETMQPVWRYEAGIAAATPPSFSEKSRAIVFCTEELQVHCIEAATGRLRWKVRPSPLPPDKDGNRVEFTGGWPVVADAHGLVFVRLGQSNIDKVLWSGGGPKGRWPETNAAIRTRLTEHPELQNLFALRLSDGSAAFIPAVGPAGVEDMHEGRPRLRVPCMPVVRIAGGREVAYLQWRNGDTRDTSWDARWDSHLGEMVLDDDTVPGLRAGDLRFVQFVEHGGWMHITDESCPLTMAGDTIFYAHWDVSAGARIMDRSPGLGLQRDAPVRTQKRPPVARHLKLSPDKLNAATHWHEGGMNLVDGRWLDGPGWWVYANVLDPPTPARNAYSEGILPRCTIVACGLVIVQGNGGDLFALRHSGR